MEKETNRFVTVAEVADLLRVSKPFVYKLIDQCKFPAFRIGRRVLVKIDDVNRFIDASRTV